MGILENLIQGNLAIHQELINKFVKEATAGNRVLSDINITITEGFLNVLAGFRTGETSTMHLKFTLSLGNFEFNRFHRFLELPVHGPVILSIQGVNIRVKGLELDLDPADQGTVPQGLLNLLQFLRVEEEKITVDFNKIPGFNQLLQHKMGFLLNFLEIHKLELLNEMIIIYPSIKLF